MPIQISASILASDFSRLGEQIRTAEAAGADWIHADVMDGHFVPNITLGPEIVRACRSSTRLPLDVHLMIEQPERHLEEFAKSGASILTVHVETCPHLYRTLQWIRDLGCQPGVTLNPGTSASTLENVLPLVDLVLVMTVSPGFGGQRYLELMNQKIARVRQMLDEIGSQAWLEVDGGLDAETVPQAYQAGARVIVAGTAIFQHPAGIAEGIRALRSSIQV